MAPRPASTNRRGTAPGPTGLSTYSLRPIFDGQGMSNSVYARDQLPTRKQTPQASPRSGTYTLQSSPTNASPSGQRKSASGPVRAMALGSAPTRLPPVEPV